MTSHGNDAARNPAARPRSCAAGSAARGLALVLFAWLAAAATAGEATPAATSRQEARLREIVAKYADPLVASGEHVGLVVAVARKGQTAVFGFGRKDLAVDAPPDGRTLFPLASITKAFTGALLALAVESGEVQMDDPADAYLPPPMRLPTVGDKKITLRHLITHTSGLPREPDDFYRAKDPDDPYVAYDMPRLVRFLDVARLATAPGAAFSYSNIGAGIAGIALARAGHASYEQLVTSRICAPLGMVDTVKTLSKEQASRLAQGYHVEDSGDGWTARPAPVMHFSECYAGCGSLLSTGNDMARFLLANLDDKSSPLGPALAISHKPLFKVDDTLSVAMGWHVLRLQGPPGPLILHPGSVAGFYSYIGFCKETHSGVVVLASGTGRLDDMAASILWDISRMGNADRRLPLDSSGPLAQPAGKESLPSPWASPPAWQSPAALPMGLRKGTLDE